MAKHDILDEAKERFRAGTSAMAETRKRMLEDLRFSNPADPEQWDPAARQAREQSSGGARPCMVFDQTNQFIAQVVNDSRQNKPSIKVIPSNDGDVKVAQVIEGMMRHIEYSSRAGIAYDTALEHAARVGLGYFRVLSVVVNDQTNEQEIRIARIHDPLSVVLDPDSTEPDGSDAMWGFIQTMFSKAAFKKQWPRARACSWDDESDFDTDQIRVCEYFHVVERKVNRLIVMVPDGTSRTTSEDEYWEDATATGQPAPVYSQYMETERVVKWVKMTGHEVLEETDFPSKWIPIIPVLGYELWVEGKRFVCGMVRRMMDSQKAYNYERSAWIEAVALQPKAPYIAAAEAIEGYENDWAVANATNKAYLSFNHVDDQGTPLPMPQRQSPPPLPAAFGAGGAQALEDLQASIGMYRANLGAPSNEKSGIAIQRRQHQGDVANFHYNDNLSRSIEHAGRIVVDMIPRIYDTKRVARITDENGSSRQVMIDPTARAAHQQRGETTVINPNVGEYDVRVKVGPSYSTLRQESAESIGNLLQAAPQLIPVLGDAFVRMQDWPEADKIARRLLAMAPPQVQEMEQGDDAVPPAIAAQMSQLKQQLEQAQKMLQAAVQQIEGKEADAQVQADKDRAELEIKAYQAETDRMKALAPAIDPVAVQAIVMQTVEQILAGPAPQQAAGAPPAMPPMAPPPPQAMPAPPMQPQSFAPDTQPADAGFLTPEGM